MKGIEEAVQRQRRELRVLQMVKGAIRNKILHGTLRSINALEWGRVTLRFSTERQKTETNERD